MHSIIDLLNICTPQNALALRDSTSFWRRSGGLGLPILPLAGIRIDI